MMAAHRLLWLLLLSTLLVYCSGWDTDDLEIFDLVEEVNANFYEVFGISQSASSSEVRKAYRKLSLVTHPDKNEAEDAAEKFRQIVAIYEVLKDETKREKYNQVLVDGLPDWKQPVFYYRRARKMGFAELFVVLFIILTIGHYFVAWGFYVERRLVVEEILSSKKKRKKKKQAGSDPMAEDEEELQKIPTPRILDLWPFQLSIFLFYAVYSLPESIRTWQEERKRRKQEEEEELAEMELLKEEVEAEVKRKPKKKAPQELPEYTNEMYASYLAPTEGMRQNDSAGEKDGIAMKGRKGQWSDEELVLLSKAVNKFPGGTHQRWEKIAEMVGRSVAEVTAKTKESKGSYQMSLSSSVQSSDFKSQAASVKISDNIISQQEPVLLDDDDQSTSAGQVRKRHRPSKIPHSVERTMMISRGTGDTGGKSKPETGSDKKDLSEKKMASDGASNGPEPPADSSGVGKTSKVIVGDELGAGEGVRKLKEPWTQNQQTIFEWALKQYPKGTDARWEKVAEHIPGKSKEDCMARFKELAFLVSQKKKNDQLQQQKQQSS